MYEDPNQNTILKSKTTFSHENQMQMSSKLSIQITHVRMANNIRPQNHSYTTTSCKRIKIQFKPQFWTRKLHFPSKITSKLSSNSSIQLIKITRKFSSNSSIQLTIRENPKQIYNPKITYIYTTTTRKMYKNTHITYKNPKKKSEYRFTHLWIAFLFLQQLIQNSNTLRILPRLKKQRRLLRKSWINRHRSVILSHRRRRCRHRRRRRRNILNILVTPYRHWRRIHFKSHRSPKKT